MHAYLLMRGKHYLKIGLTPDPDDLQLIKFFSREYVVNSFADHANDWADHFFH